MKNVLFGSYCSSDCLNHFLSYLGRVFESLTKEIIIFQRFENFRCFRTFGLNYGANFKEQKRRKS